MSRVNAADKAATRILFDQRWQGAHGIGRYASEVLARLEGRIPHASFSAGVVRHSDFWELGRAVHRCRAAVLYSPGFHAAWPSRVDQFLTVHDLIHLDVPSERSAAKSLYYDRVVRPAVARAGLVFTVSEYSKARLVERFRIGPDEVVVTSNGCSASFLEPAPSFGEGESPYVLCVANAKPYKNLQLMIEATRYLPRDWQVICVGTPEESGRQLVSGEFGARFRWLSGITDAALRDLYAGAQAVAIPSRLEGFGLPAVEAMGQGAPVVYCAEVIAEVTGDLGVRVPDPQDPEGFAAALQRVAAEDAADLRARRTHRAREFSWQRVADRVYDALAERLPSSAAWPSAD